MATVIGWLWLDRPGRGPAGRSGRDPIAGFEPDRPRRTVRGCGCWSGSLPSLTWAPHWPRRVTGRGRVALISGGAGIGKTSVVRTFLAGLDTGVRVLEGACDDLLTPRPFGPVHDVSRSARPALARALAEGPAQSVFTALLDELTDGAAARLIDGSAATVLVVGDVHWADDASLDALAFVARRIEGLRAMLVLTYRDDEVPVVSLLQRVLGGLRAPVGVRIPLGPLSARAVTQLAGEPGAGLRVFASTGGNPFFVTELLAAEQEGLPASVSQAMLARVARLPEPTRALLDLLAVVPTRAETGLLDAVYPDWPEAAAAGEERGVITGAHRGEHGRTSPQGLRDRAEVVGSRRAAAHGSRRGPSV